MIWHTFTNSEGKTRGREIQPKIGHLNIDHTTPTEVWSFVPQRSEDYHNSPRRVWIVTMEGELTIGYKDGSSQKLGPGDVHLQDDLTGEGHTILVSSSINRVATVIPLTQEWPEHKSAEMPGSVTHLS